MAPADSLPALGSYGEGSKQQFVAFCAPITTGVSRLNALSAEWRRSAEERASSDSASVGRQIDPTTN